MCGICGIASTDHSALIDPVVIRRMRDSLAHRGPDDKGVYIGPGVALGHRRLSIIDLRPEGRQPMANEDGSVQIVFNGEIYNFAEHYQWLIARGHQFRSRTDTEVIIHLYEELGVRCLDRLRGMFAFAIWDERRRRLFLARDRLGKKPLYYYCDGERLLFASEAKGILTCPGLSFEPDPAAINYFISFGYIPGARSAFERILKLPPAHYLLFDRAGVRLERYWRLHYFPKARLNENEAHAELVERMTDATKVRLRSDVPLGAFLSGGIDSSSIVALMTKLSNQRVKTFSIGFDEPEYDESAFAREVAQQFGTDHHELVVRPDARVVLDKLVWHYDEPFADSSALLVYYLSQLTREHVTVALTGDAGDENFMGYQRQAYAMLAHQLHSSAVLRATIQHAARAASCLVPKKGEVGRKLRFLQGILELTPELWNIRTAMCFEDQEKGKLYNRDFLNAVEGRSAEDFALKIYSETDAEDAVDLVLNFDLNCYLPYDLLVKTDIASMAVGLEVRAPMVDHEFIEFVARLPARFKTSGLAIKPLLKKAFRDLLPASVLNRRKQGFSVPLDRWFRTDLKEFLCDLLLSRRCRERHYFKARYIENLISDHLSGRRNTDRQLWTLLVLEMWHRVHIDNSTNELGHQAGVAAS
jgi:asparagine synthase (glutamine-hydrolysing)